MSLRERKKDINTKTGEKMMFINASDSYGEIELIMFPKVYNKYLKNTDFKVIKGENHALLSASDGLILASGTVALEACLYKTPMIIAYKGPWLFYLIYLLVRCIKLVSLPNIILNRLFVPELLMNDVNSQKISYEIEKILYDNEYQKFCLNEFAEVEDLLSDKISSQEVAEEIVNKLNN